MCRISWTFGLFQTGDILKTLHDNQSWVREAGWGWCWRRDGNMAETLSQTALMEAVTRLERILSDQVNCSSPRVTAAKQILFVYF